ncbi:hypothetical protein BC937DRAFT_87209 [Endogone sp. FLAS-F59071]|nr:hypothetical protein BC937DRAFT_87209 [Endogone sp. FLAS-F59071]|eukprot:RUS19610.1 hypothetical protein BC937DRAFT_87209 [Endogone sp. FLAS-F59071]
MSNDQTTSIVLAQVTQNPKRLPPKRPTEKTSCPQCGKLGAWVKSKWNLEEHMKRDVCILNRKTPGPPSHFTGIETRPDPKEGMEQGVLSGPADDDVSISLPSVPHQQNFVGELSELSHGVSGVCAVPDGQENLLTIYNNNGLPNSNSSYSQSDIDLQESATVESSHKRRRQNDDEDDSGLRHSLNSASDYNTLDGNVDPYKKRQHDSEISEWLIIYELLSLFVAFCIVFLMEHTLTISFSKTHSSAQPYQTSTTVDLPTSGTDGYTFSGNETPNALEAFINHQHHQQQQQSYMSQQPQLLPSPQSDQGMFNSSDSRTPYQQSSQEFPPVDLVVKLTAVAMKAVLEQSSRTPYQQSAQELPSVELVVKLTAVAMKAVLEQSSQEFTPSFELAMKAAATAVKAGLEDLGYRFRRQ